MPWCPKCKNEFQEGITICSDCKVELVDELTVEEEYVPFFQAEQKNIAEKLQKYFKYSALTSVIRYNNEHEVYILYVPSGQMKQAKKLYQAFYFVERERHEKELLSMASTEDSDPLNQENEFEKMNELSEEPRIAEDFEAIHPTLEDYPVMEESVMENPEQEDQEVDFLELEDNLESGDESLGNEPETFQTGSALYSDTWNKVKSEEDENEVEMPMFPQETAYVMKADKYKDYNSTVWIFLLMGIAGIVFVILNITGILTFLYGIFPNTVMGALFLSFIYIGLSTYQKAKKIQSEIDDETKLTEQINQWLKENVTKDYLSSLQDDTISEELNYIKFTETVKEQLNEKFGKQNEAYLDHLIEEYYSANFDVQE